MPPMTPDQPPFCYLNPFKYIVGEREIGSCIIFEFSERPTEEQLDKAVAEYWENFYGEDSEGNPDSNRDGCVVFYD